MDLGISGRRAIVCASSRGLGKACALALASAGVSVAINGRDEDVLVQTAEEISTATGAQIIPVVADVGTSDGRAALLAAMPEPDILVNNNSGPPLKGFRDIDRQAMLDGVEMNMVTPIQMIQAVIDPMIARQFGRIVNITSFSVKMPVTGLDLSSGARAGLTGFVAGVAREVAPNNVTVNNLLPGYFDTDRLKGALDGMAKLKGVTAKVLADGAKATIPAARFGSPEEFGGTCAFLCSVQAAYMTGQNILLDGGFYPSSF